MTKEFTGRKMAIIVTSFFAVVFAANISLAVMASKSWTGLVVENSYVASQHFNEVTDKLEKSLAMDVHTKLSYENGKLRLSLNAASGAAVEVRNVVLKIGRPSHEGEDQNLTMVCGEAGICTADANLGLGLWSGEVDAELASRQSWTRRVQLWVRAG